LSGLVWSGVVWSASGLVLSLSRLSSCLLSFVFALYPLSFERLSSVIVGAVFF
jgi:hypothetical protein